MPATFRSHIHQDDYRIVSDWCGERERLLPAQNVTAGAMVQVLVRPLPEPVDPHQLVAACRPLLGFEHKQVAKLHDLVVTDSHVGLIYEQVEGISLYQASNAGRKILAANQALTIIHDCIQGLIALARSGLHHGNLDLNHVVITPQKTFVLLATVPPEWERLTAPTACFEDSRLLTVAPERYADEPQTSLATDTFSLGSMLFSLLASNPLVAASDREQIQELMARGDFLDCEIQLAQHPDAVVNIIKCCLSQSAADRYGNPNDLRHDCSLAMVDCQAERAEKIQRQSSSQSLHSDATARSSQAIDVSDIQAHLAQRQQVDPGITASISPISYKTKKTPSGRLAKLVKVSSDGLEARIKLGPKVRMQEEMLRQVLTMEGIVHGVLESGLLLAATPRDMVRKIILAEGTKPEPGRPGMDVHGQVLPALDQDIVLEVSKDKMQVQALVRANAVIDEQEVLQALKQDEVIRGIKKDVIAELVSVGSEDGHELIAEGRQPTHGEPAQFRLAGDAAEQERRGEPALVAKDQFFAKWDIPRLGKDGFDVFGHALTAQQPDGLEQGLAAGPGCAVQQHEGESWLQAEQDGVVRLTPEGIFQVKRVERIPGGIKAGQVIDSDAVLIIQGDIEDGAEVTCSGDICVLGDVGNAKVTVGGELTVAGHIKAGDQQIAVGGNVEVETISNRHVVGARVTVKETIHYSDVVAKGSIHAKQAIGGRLTAAENFIIDEIGSEEAEQTMVWAGYHVPKAVERDLAEMNVRRAVQDRELMLKEREVFQKIVEQIEHKNYMQHVLGYMAEDYKKSMNKRFQQVKKRLESLQETMTGNQGQLADLRHDMHEIGDEVTNESAAVEITGTLHPGVEIKIADTHTRRIQARQDNVTIKL